MHIRAAARTVLLGIGLLLCVWPARAATTLLPIGESCFQTATGPVSSGSVNMYTPSTTTPKTTWQDSGQHATNTNPIQLDANGCAIIYGTGSYRQQLYSGPVVGGVTTGNLIFDLVTADTSSYQNVFWSGLAGGTPNAITVIDAGFNNTDGSVINFIALAANTSSTTISVSGGTAIPVKEQSASGPQTLSAGCIAANNPVSVVYSSTAASFLLLTPCAASATAVAAVVAPQGYLSLASDTSNPVITADVTGSTNVYYTPYVGSQVPIWNGSSYSLFSIGQLILTLSASNIGNTIYDVFVFSNSGVPTLVTGPAWSNSGAGTSARGTGAGTTQLQRNAGLWVNAVQITGLNGVNSYTIAAEQATYLGSILIDQTAGQVSNYVAVGQNRKWGVWNAYNRQPLTLMVTDPTVGWSYNTVTRASNGTVGNAATVLNGLPEEQVYAVFNQVVFGSVGGSSNVHGGIGLNSTTVFSGMEGGWGVSPNSSSNTGTIVGTFTDPPSLGLNNFYSLEEGNNSGTNIWSGTVTNMLMTLKWRG